MLTEEERDILCFKTTVICIRDDINNELPELNCLLPYVFVAVVSILIGQYFPAKNNFPEKCPAACFLCTPAHGRFFFFLEILDKYVGKQMFVSKYHVRQLIVTK